jgi:hypothetical protein
MKITTKYKYKKSPDRVEYPLSEILDRAAITKLKMERIPEEKENLKNDYKKLMRAIKYYEYDQTKIKAWFKELYDINSSIWYLEANIRKGDLGGISLKEVGKTAIEIRKNNKIRVSIKNKIVEATGDGFKEIKMNHASE